MSEASSGSPTDFGRLYCAMRIVELERSVAQPSGTLYRSSAVAGTNGGTGVRVGTCEAGGLAGVVLPNSASVACGDLDEALRIIYTLNMGRGCHRRWRSVSRI